MLRPSRSPVRQCCCAPGAITTGAYFGEERRNAPDPVARQCDVTNDHCRAVSRPRGCVASEERCLLGYAYLFINLFIQLSLILRGKKKFKTMGEAVGGGGDSVGGSGLQYWCNYLITRKTGSSHRIPSPSQLIMQV